MLCLHPARLSRRQARWVSCPAATHGFASCMYPRVLPKALTAWSLSLVLRGLGVSVLCVPHYGYIGRFNTLNTTSYPPAKPRTRKTRTPYIWSKYTEMVAITCLPIPTGREPGKRHQHIQLPLGCRRGHRYLEDVNCFQLIESTVWISDAPENQTPIPLESRSVSPSHQTCPALLRHCTRNRDPFHGPIFPSERPLKIIRSRIVLIKLL